MKDIIATDSVQTSWTIHVAEAGLYNVTVTASGIVNGNVGTHGNYSSYSYEDRIGGSSIASFSTVVFPTAKFEYSPSKPYADEEIIFNASASYSPEGNVTSYEWNFDDGNKTAITEPVINHAYNQPGRYNVTLTVTDSSTLTNTATRMIPVYYITDLNKDRTVNILDVFAVAMVFGSNPDDPNWKAVADLNKDGTVNVLDIFAVAWDFGKTT